MIIMKKSKIFLAGTTCLLAIVGVAATRTHFGTLEQVYSHRVGQVKCTVLKAPVGSTQQINGAAKIGFSYNASQCSTPLYVNTTE